MLRCVYQDSREAFQIVGLVALLIVALLGRLQIIESTEEQTSWESALAEGAGWKGSQNNFLHTENQQVRVCTI